MKHIILFFLFTSLSPFLFSQNDIVNTLGSGGKFTIKDANNTFLTLNQATGEINILNGLRIEKTYNSSTIGVIFKGTDRFIHDFRPVSGQGYNTFVGINSGNFSTSSTNGIEASYNTAFGSSTLTDLTTGYFNTSIGCFSLRFNTIGYSNTALGYASLNKNTEGINNTAVGSEALNNNVDGDYCTAVGGQSLYYNTSGTQNTAVGYASLYSNSTGNLNTAVGLWALSNNSTGSQNTAVGNSACNNNTTGNNNTAFGYNALIDNSTGFNNTAIGHHSLMNNTGNYNTALGFNAGSNVTSGANLTLLGIDANPSTGTAQNEITLGNQFVQTLRCNTQSITSLSDARDKKNIRDLDLGLDFLMKIKPRIFNWDRREWYDNNVSNGSKMKQEPTAGFIAQELDEAQTEANAEWLNLVLKTNPDKLEATSGNLLPIIVKAIQDLKKENDELKAVNDDLIVANDKLCKSNIELIARLTNFEQIQSKIVTQLEELRTNNQLTTKVSMDAK
jgi:hypothetical protein